MEQRDAFVNRLGKMARHYGKWARRQGITCYRIYDADLTAYPLAIDRYGEWVHVAEYQRGQGEDDEGYGSWKADVLAMIGEVLEVPPDCLFYKERRPQRGNAQYEKRGTAGHERVVEEGGLKFLVNLEDYLDTGLFLDHRQTRSMVRAECRGKRVLNLFGYTGSFTVYAAAGGAKETLTLDLSRTYLDWAGRNLVLNGWDGPEHRLERVDVMDWLADRPRGVWDHIILDPPTFSNSKMTRQFLDVQRDHAGMIGACLMRLAPGGTLWFSTNHRRFRLDESALPVWTEVREITAQTLPPDFRSGRAHRCWRMKGP